LCLGEEHLHDKNFVPLISRSSLAGQVEDEGESADPGSPVRWENQLTTQVHLSGGGRGRISWPRFTWKSAIKWMHNLVHRANMSSLQI